MVMFRREHSSRRESILNCWIRFQTPLLVYPTSDSLNPLTKHTHTESSRKKYCLVTEILFTNQVIMQFRGIGLHQSCQLRHSQWWWTLHFHRRSIQEYEKLLGINCLNQHSPMHQTFFSVIVFPHERHMPYAQPNGVQTEFVFGIGKTDAWRNESWLTTSAF